MANSGLRDTVIRSREKNVGFQLHKAEGVSLPSGGMVAEGTRDTRIT